jgi:phospholipid/cholesterol/gamma-HCH transport system substrate-binding protein
MTELMTNQHRGGNLPRITGRAGAAIVAVLLLAGTFLVHRGGGETKTVTAHFPRAVSVYEGTDVRILGVNVGSVTAVIPEGNSVRVEMEYDAKYPVPADAKAAIVTPTLVADRFVQLTPAYVEGDKVMETGAEIPLPDTGVPVELDRIYASLRDLTDALGPNGVNANGTLDHTLNAAANAFEGNGALGNQMLRNLSEAAVTFGEGSGDLFETVSSLAEFTDVLAKNDAVVRAFMKDLAAVSTALADEREELSAALASVADAVGTVENFVKQNRKALVTDLDKLTRVLKTINSERESIDTALTVAPVAIGNLVLAYDTPSGSIGSRIGIQPNIWDLDGFLCAVVQQSGMPAVSKELACTIFEQIVESGQMPSRQAALKAVRDAEARVSSGATTADPRARGVQADYAIGDEGSLPELLGGAS